jgi:hypothetical protein
MVSKKRLTGALTFVFVILLVGFGPYLVYKGLVDSGALDAEYCLPESYDIDENGNYIPPEGKICVGGAWVDIDIPAEGTLQTECIDDHKLVEAQVVNRQWQVSTTVADGNEYCEDGDIKQIPPNCGNRICNTGETITNCPIDCGVFLDWAGYVDSVSQRSSLQTYLEEEYQMDYMHPSVQDAIRQIKQQYPDSRESPYNWQLRASQWLIANMEYILGGVRLCDERASEILQRGTGNCIDYSILYCSLLRAEGIPCRQVEGCVANWNPVYCIPFAVERWDVDLTGTVKGHSWVEMWIGNRWLSADPTRGAGASRTCVGYRKLAVTEGNNLCRISKEEDLDFCRTF